MAKNDYRRSLIMMRGMEKGYSGHARLESRAASGTLDIVVSSPEPNDVLKAALIGKRGAGYSAKPLGHFKSDSRGQKGLLSSFDPRNIAGMDLKDVYLAVVARMENGRAVPVMTGFVNGSKPVDYGQVRSLIDQLLSDPPSAPSAIESADTEAPANTPAPEKEIENEPQDAEIPEKANPSGEGEPVSEAPENSRDATENSANTPQNSAQAPQNSDAPEPLSNPPLPDGEQKSVGAPAGSLLGIDMRKPWPEDIEPLRLLFLTAPAYEPFKKDDYVFVRAKMAEETGIDHCAVGVRAQDGKIAGVCYAIPMPYTREAPPGLEGYEWIGNSTAGWWVTCDDLTDSE